MLSILAHDKYSVWLMYCPIPSGISFHESNSNNTDNYLKWYFVPSQTKLEVIANIYIRDLTEGKQNGLNTCY